MSLSPVTIRGDSTPGVTYILRMGVEQDLALAFGRFKQGEIIPVPAGECVYIGSALGQRGSMTLGRRLVRHASRSGNQPPHPIRVSLLHEFARLGWGDLRPTNLKRLRWNVDYLLDQPVVALSHILLIRSELRLEAELAQWLENDPHTFLLEKGLGANDVPGNTHLLGVQADEGWWTTVQDELMELFSTRF